MERLKIQNFAGIKEMDFEFKSITVLIGPQASGKSVSIKLLYFIKRYISDVIDSIVSGETQLEFDRQQKEKFINYFPKDSWPKENFKISYLSNDIEIKISKQKNSINIISSTSLKKVIGELRTIFNDEKKSLTSDNKLPSFQSRFNIESKLRNHFSKNFSAATLHNQFFIPAGRSFFANVQKSIFSFLSDNRSLDPFLIEFGSFYENFKGIYEDIHVRNNDNAFLSGISSILNSDYKREKDKDYLIHSDHRKVNLSNASSGQQETLPLMIILAVLNKIGFSRGGATLYIEEPEAHLFPVAQKRIVQLLAKVFNNKESKFQIIVTTHSPYILASFNNLLEAGQLSSIKPRKAKLIANVIPKDEQIHPELFSAYSLNNGHKQIIIDDDTKLISQTVLDSISNEIAKEFGELLDIEY